MKDTLTYMAEGITGSLRSKWLIDRQGDTVTLTWIIDIDYSTQVTLTGGAAGVRGRHGNSVVTYAPDTNGVEGLSSVPTPDLFIIAVLDMLVEDGGGLERYTEYLNSSTRKGKA